MSAHLTWLCLICGQRVPPLVLICDDCAERNKAPTPTPVSSE